MSLPRPLRAAPLALALALVCLSAPAARATTTPPSFTNYVAPSPFDQLDAGEPSIGFNPKTGATLYQAGTTTLRVDFSKNPVTWADVTDPTNPISADPILFTDRSTGRTFNSQLLTACSRMSITDSDGPPWSPSQGCGVGTAFDHQTVGAGPFSASDTLPHTYPDAVYYCAQAQVSAQCAQSRDGGVTFGAGVPVYTFAQCVTLHGHIKVAPDGTAYLPNFDCGGKQTLVTTRDGGKTWTQDKVPDSTTQDKSDPSVGIGSAGSLYLGYQGAEGTNLNNPNYVTYSEGHAMIAVKRAGSATWARSVDVGAALGVKNVEFPEVVAGDDNRAAYAFLGTTTAGDDQSADFKGVWHLYVATTDDAGQTWTAVDATPTDPVQRGCIYLQGGSNACRNLLDFNDITIDSQGNALVAYADGCTGGCVTNPNDYTTKTSVPTIARQQGGSAVLANPPERAAPPVGGPTLGGVGRSRCDDAVAPKSRFVKRGMRATRRGVVLHGRSTDRGCGKKGAGRVAKVRVAIARKSGKRCRFLHANGHFGRRVSCLRTTYLSASGKGTWRATLHHRLPAGKYIAWARGIDGSGNVERKAFKRNLLRFRIR